jgi:Flp pilus assembly pilin Flp
MLNGFRSGQGAAGAIEYALMFGLIAVGLITVVSNLGSSLSRISCGLANVFGNIATMVLADGGNSHPCVYQDTCHGAAVGSVCYRANANGGFDTVVVAQVNTLYAWPSDEQATYWNNGTTNYTTTGTTSSTNGMSNTNTLVALNDAGAPYNAAKTCRAHGPDWYLPASNELLTIENAAGQNGVGSLSFYANGTFYWTSTEGDSSHAWNNAYPIPNGPWQLEGGALKQYTHIFRCARQ